MASSFFTHALAVLLDHPWLLTSFCGSVIWVGGIVIGIEFGKTRRDVAAQDEIASLRNAADYWHADATHLRANGYHDHPLRHPTYRSSVDALVGFQGARVEEQP